MADTLGGGGLLVEESRAKFSPGQSYFAIVVCAIALIWGTSIFKIIVYASRAFTFYDLAQSVFAVQVVMAWPSGWTKTKLLVKFGLMASILAWVVIFAIPVD